MIPRAVPEGLGSPVLAIAVLALGVMNLYRGDFTVIYHPMPDMIPARPVIAAICNTILAAAGAAILLGRWPIAAIVLAVDIALLSAGWVQRVVLFPGLIGTWLGLAEQLAIAIGALAIFARARTAPVSLATICRISFGACQVVFALAHILSLPETIAMTPAYLPPGPRFWALATGALHLIGGILLVSGVWPGIVTRGLAAMFLSFGLMVWLPRLLEAPGAPEAWAGNLVNLALIGAVLTVGEASLARNEAKRVAEPA